MVGQLPERERIPNIASWLGSYQGTPMPVRRSRRASADYCMTATDGYALCAAVISSQVLGCRSYYKNDGEPRVVPDLRRVIE